ncbi:MAG: hypothetical protein ACI9XZ_000420 [Alphaproteobacteria bacterium]|jgi:hypothetical protein
MPQLIVGAGTNLIGFFLPILISRTGAGEPQRLFLIGGNSMILADIDLSAFVQTRLASAISLALQMSGGGCLAVFARAFPGLALDGAGVGSGTILDGDWADAVAAY